MIDEKKPQIVVFGKFAGFGILVIGLAALLFASAFFIRVANEAHATPPASTTETATPHDFQLTQLGTFRRDQFLVDKNTGRIWQTICVGKVNGPDCNGMLIWDEMYVSQVTPMDSSAGRTYLEFISKR